MKRALLLALGFVVSSSLIAAAADADPNGTWKWSQMFGKDSQSREVTLKLKLEGDKLTGTMSGREGAEDKIEDGSFKDGEVKFAVTRDRNGMKFTTKYTGKVDGDAIKGKVEFSRGEKSQSRDWEAKREKK
jgi:hypothetical protein